MVALSACRSGDSRDRDRLAVNYFRRLFHDAAGDQSRLSAAHEGRSYRRPRDRPDLRSLRQLGACRGSGSRGYSFDRAAFATQSPRDRRHPIAKTCLQLLHRSITLLRCGFTPVYALLGRFLPRLKAASGRPPFLAMTVRVRPTATRGPPFLIFRSCLCTSWVSRGECAPAEVGLCGFLGCRPTLEGLQQRRRLATEYIGQDQAPVREVAFSHGA